MEQRCNRMISDWLLSLLFMSILTIGERSIYNYHSPYFSNNSDQLTMARRQKRIRQQQYRLELIGQMNQKYQRTKRRRRNEQQIAYNPKYERMRTLQPYNQYQAKNNIFNSKRQFNNDSSLSIHKIRRKKPQFEEFIPSSYSYVQKPNYQLSKDFSSNYRANKFDQRVKTQEVNLSDKFDNIIVDLQKRRQELSNYDDKKIEEVYERMYDSVQKLNNQNNTPYYSPLRHHLQTDDRKYDRYNKNITKSIPNPEQEQSLYFNKLPPLFKNNQLERQDRSVDNTQKNWKEWYAKQKLRQLQSYYKKIVGNEQASRVSRMNGQRGRENNY